MGNRAEGGVDAATEGERASSGAVGREEGGAGPGTWWGSECEPGRDRALEGLDRKGGPEVWVRRVGLG